MAWKAKDGTEYTNKMMADRRNRSLAAKAEERRLGGRTGLRRLGAELAGDAAAARGDAGGFSGGAGGFDPNDAGQDPRALGAADGGADEQQPAGDIQNDPRAMQLVDELKQMGYTGEEVAQAMDADDDAQSGQAQGGMQAGGVQSAGGGASQGAPLQIPGMQ